ncbi:roadblock/LC7 domain-containing protein [Streptomyces avicenniae]|uniref:roadblock/LC7 domain-containing protein n=1 Tax=Streptomyces avicenniae TaxID=500153 RepID=UPI00069A9DBD|nr:roadblock/LC7 domain-containing protein [Streptomyces avicenniae]
MTAPKDTAAGPPPQTGHGSDTARLDGLLADLADRVPDVRHALLLASDGLPRGGSRGLAQSDAEQLAAVASGFHSLARGVGGHFATGSVRQTLVELDDAFLLVTAAGRGSALAVLAEVEADLGQIAYEMALLVKRAAPLLQTPPRHGPA